MSNNLDSSSLFHSHKGFIHHRSFKKSVKLDARRGRNTDTITFRLDKDTLDKIRNAAKREKTSPNGLVNNILESYIQWELNALQAGWTLMPKRFLSTRKAANISSPLI